MKIMAKDLVRTRKNIKKFHMMKIQLNSVNMKLMVWICYYLHSIYLLFFVLFCFELLCLSLQVYAFVTLGIENQRIYGKSYGRLYKGIIIVMNHMIKCRVLLGLKHSQYVWPNRFSPNVFFLMSIFFGLCYDRLWVK